MSARAKFASLVVALPLFVATASAQSRVEVVPNEAARRVDVSVDGKPFTSYIWPTTRKKPVLYPLRTAKGTLVTRGYPLEPRKGERVDHPHHVGLWFNHGDVNGLDFWNNSDAIPADHRSMIGRSADRPGNGVSIGIEILSRNAKDPGDDLFSRGATP